MRPRLGSLNRRTSSGTVAQHTPVFSSPTSLVRIYHHLSQHWLTPGVFSSKAPTLSPTESEDNDTLADLPEPRYDDEDGNAVVRRLHTTRPLGNSAFLALERFL